MTSPRLADPEKLILLIQLAALLGDLALRLSWLSVIVLVGLLHVQYFEIQFKFIRLLVLLLLHLLRLNICLRDIHELGSVVLVLSQSRGR